MRTLIATLAVLLFSAPAAAQQWRDDDLGEAIVEGVASHDHIWLLGSSGAVVRFDRQTGERQVVATGARDMLRDDGRLWVLTRLEGAANYEVHDLRSDQNPEPNGPRIYLDPSEVGGGNPVGIVAWPGQTRPAILTQGALFVPVTEGWEQRRLAASLSQRGHIAMTDGDMIYVGYNLGEWGGGLRRIDPADGAIAFVRDQSDRPCRGVLNPECSPIVGVFHDRDNTDCVLVGTGISHLGSSRGDVYRVCGSKISGVFTTPTPARRDQWSLGPQPWPLHNFIEAPGGWIGISRGRYFRSKDGSVAEHPLPIFSPWSGIRISEEQDGVLFIVSACCWGSENNPLYGSLALPIMP